MAFLLGFFISTILPLISAFILPGNPNFLPFNDGFNTLFGEQNIQILNTTSVRISLTESSGSGFVSRRLYDNAFFSASIKVPPNNTTAGVVVAFYTSNENVSESNHDELDFEFLGNVPGQPWIIQTNVYGNGSVIRGREERCNIWFDPTQDFHNYSILWNKDWTVFYVDDVPIRQVRRVDAMGGDYPSKPASLYATIWDGSSWATDGGKHKVDYRFAPFQADFTNLIIDGGGCTLEHIDQCKNGISRFVADFNGLKPNEIEKMKQFRNKYMSYSYCLDRKRYPIALPECKQSRLV